VMTGDRREAGQVIAAFSRIARPIMRMFMSASSCIAAARTTIEVMRIYGIAAVAIPVKYCFVVRAQKYQRVGGLSDAERTKFLAKGHALLIEPDAEGCWNGHLVVRVDNRWLIDASIDQMASEEFGVPVPCEIFTVDLSGHDWNPEKNFEINILLELDSGDQARLNYIGISDKSYLETDAWNDEGLLLLARAIAFDMELKG
jgi:hypothetical protein